MVRKKRRCTPSTSAGDFARSGNTSGSGPKQLVLPDVLPPFQGEKRVVFLAILPVARMVIWTTRKKGLYDDASFSRRDLVLYFRHENA